MPATAEAAVPGLAEAERPAAAEAAMPGLVEAELPAVSSRIFAVSSLIFKYLIHFELIFFCVCSVT